jgi:hypothetical protein
LADKTTRAVVDALTRLAAEPHGLPLFARKNEEGLFAGTALAKSTAERCRAEGWIAVTADDAEWATLTDAGRAYLRERTDPRQVVEDFLRIVEARQEEVSGIGRSLDHLRSSLDAMRRTLLDVLPANAIPGGELDARIIERLSHWRDAEHDADYPIPRLYRDLPEPRPSIGLFHDALRRLHERGKIATHPWTGPLYALPEPQFALLVGHEIAYYVNVR